MKVLIIDDSKTARIVVRKCVESVVGVGGDDIIEAANAEDALQILHGRSFDLIISDVNMPGMTGFDFLKKLKEENIIPGIPIAFLTSYANEASVQNLMSCGATDVIKKPASPKAIADLLIKVKGQKSDDNAWG